jgi:N-glycosidase YbiA
LLAGARQVRTEAASLFPPAEETVLVSRAVVTQLEAALGDYEALRKTFEGQAAVTITVTRDEQTTLEVWMIIPQAQAQVTAQTIIARLKKAAEVKPLVKKETIYFDRARDKKYGLLVEAARTLIFLKGKYWPSPLHYYQAQKFAGTPLEDQIRTALSPAEAAAIAHGRHDLVRPDWQQVRLEVMREALWAKFTQHKPARELLLQTGNALLVKRARDNYWGNGQDGQGKNMLGRLLMGIRTKLREGAS